MKYKNWIKYFFNILSHKNLVLTILLLILFVKSSGVFVSLTDTGTDPNNAEEGTLRKLYGISIDKNSVHGSDSVENAKKEISFFFKD